MLSIIQIFLVSVIEECCDEGSDEVIFCPLLCRCITSVLFLIRDLRKHPPSANYSTSSISIAIPLKLKNFLTLDSRRWLPWN